MTFQKGMVLDTPFFFFKIMKGDVASANKFERVMTFCDDVNLLEGWLKIQFVYGYS